jgi:hypothetical protein
LGGETRLDSIRAGDIVCLSLQMLFWQRGIAMKLSLYGLLYRTIYLLTVLNDQHVVRTNASERARKVRTRRGEVGQCPSS